MRTVSLLAVIGGSVLLAGCNTTDSPLIFGKVNSLGIQIAATVPDQGGNLTLGYRSANIAVVPVTAHDATGHVFPLNSSQGPQGSIVRDSLSTFAHFESQAGVPVKACLGDIFATGLAAAKLSEKLTAICKP